MNQKITTMSKMILTLSIITGLLSCNNDKTTQTTETNMKDTLSAEKQIALKPAGPVPAWAPSIKPEMQVVVDKLATLGGKPIETLEAAEARLQPTPADAVKEVMAENNIPVPPAKCDIANKSIPVTGGTTNVRIYTPKTGTAPFPVIVYYHGGGWIIADLDVYNASAQGLCEQVGAVVVSVEYPKGPEKKFPVAHTVCFDAYQWVIANASSIRADATKIAVVGESAGGNLAANMSMMARDKKIVMPLYQVLVYPVANNDMNSASYTKFADAKPLSKAMMVWFVKNALTSEAQAADPRISLVKANLAGLPKTLIIGAEIDPLQTEGSLLNDKLNAAGVASEYKLYEGVTHEFFGMAAVVPQAKEAQALAASRLKAAFGL